MKGFILCSRCDKQFTIDEVDYLSNIEYKLPNTCPKCKKGSEKRKFIKIRDCSNCMHEVRDYCKAYKMSINIIDISKCKRWIVNWNKVEATK